MGAHVDKQDVVFEAGLFSVGKLYFSRSSKATLFSSFYVCSAFNQGCDLQTICVKSSSQRNRCWDRIRSVMALLGKDVYYLWEQKDKKQDWTRDAFRVGCWYDTQERKGDKEDWAGRAQTMMQFWQSSANPQGAAEEPMSTRRISDEVE